MTSVLLASGVSEVSTGVTLLFAAILVGLIACLAFEEKLHAKKSVIAGSFAIVSLLLGAVCGILPFEKVVVGSGELARHGPIDGVYEDVRDQPREIHIPSVADDDVQEPASPMADATQPVEPVESSAAPEASDEVDALGDDAEVVEEVHVGGDRISMPVYIPAIDWGVIAIILGSSLFVDVTSKSGLFTWIAIKVTKASLGDPLILLAAYGVMTVVFSAVLNNVTAMIIVGSLTAVSLDKLQRTDQLLGFLLIEGLLTNVGGLLTLISSVPNIIVGTSAGISFVKFFVCAFPYVLVATAGTIWLGARLFGVTRLKDEEARQEAAGLVAGFDENDGVESPSFFWFGVVMLGLFIVTIATTSVLPYISDLQMGFVALSFAGVMLLRYKSEADQFYRALDWDLLAFFMALFVVINVMEHAHVLDAIGVALARVIALGDVLGAGLVLIASAVFSSVTDNIPLAAMLSKILVRLGTDADSALWWSVIFGANLGGNLTPIGSASTLVAVTIIHRHGLQLSFMGFVMLAWPFACLQIALATAYVLLVLR